MDELKVKLQMIEELESKIEELNEQKKIVEKEIQTIKKNNPKYPKELEIPFTYD